MKISQITTFAALQLDGRPAAFVVRVGAACGQTGYGEAAADVEGPGGGSGALVDQIAAGAEVLRGRDAGNLNAALDALAGVAGCGPAARAALDTAMHDLLAKMRGVPVHTVLGGAQRMRLELSVDLGRLDGRSADALTPGGAHLVWLGGDGDAERDALEALVTAAARVGARIEVDARGCFAGPGEARRFIEPVLRRGVLSHLSLRQPLHAHDLEGHAMLRETLPIPVVLDGSVTSPQAALQIVRRDAADRIVVELGRVGGLDAGRRMADIAEAAGTGVSFCAPASVGILAAAQCHLAATLRDPYPVAFAPAPIPPVVGGFDVVGREGRLSGRPGLGIEVDEAALAEVMSFA